MQKWEYLMVTADRIGDEFLNSHGRDGWELAHMSAGHEIGTPGSPRTGWVLVFKKPKS